MQVSFTRVKRWHEPCCYGDLVDDKLVAKTKKLLGVQTTLMQIWQMCVWGLYLSLKLEPMLDCSIVPIKHIFNATQKSRYGTTRAGKGRRVRPRAASNIRSKDGAFQRNVKPHQGLLASRLQLFAGSVQQRGLFVSV